MSTIVVTNGNDSGPGSLRQAIEDANPGDIITFEPSVNNIIVTSRLFIDKILTISGTGKDNLTISTFLNINGIFRINEKTDSIVNTTISDLTITQTNDSPDTRGVSYFKSGTHYLINVKIFNCGYTETHESGGAIENRAILNIINCELLTNRVDVDSGYGGAIYNSGTLNIDNCQISGNTINTFSSGGAIFSENGTLNINNCQISGNTTRMYGKGGAIFSENGTLNIDNCQVSRNTMDDHSKGGGIYCANGIFNIDNCQISENTTNMFSAGGGIYCVNGNINVDNCQISENTTDFASRGGGIYCVDGNINIGNSTIYGNESSDGGGIYVSSEAYLINCTIVNNTSRNQGGGIFNTGNALNIGNTIVSLNTPDNIFGNYNNLGNGNNNLIYIDPRLGPLQNNGGSTLTMMPSTPSPAINKGDNTLVKSEYDQRGPGFPRIVGDIVDIGSVETSTPPIKSTPINSATPIKVGTGPVCFSYIPFSGYSSFNDQNGTQINFNLDQYNILFQFYNYTGDDDTANKSFVMYVGIDINNADVMNTINNMTIFQADQINTILANNSKGYANIYLESILSSDDDPIMQYEFQQPLNYELFENGIILPKTDGSPINIKFVFGYPSKNIDIRYDIKNINCNNPASTVAVITKLGFYTQLQITGLGASAIPPDFQSPTSVPRMNIIINMTRENINNTDGYTDGYEISDIDVSIVDYYEYLLCRDCFCWKDLGNNTIESKFVIYHPDFYLVVKGCGCTLVEKIVDYLDGNLSEVHTLKKIGSILGYATMVYVLSAFLYHKFSLEYLRSSYFPTFYRDLVNSRFSHFAELFTDPNVFEDPQYSFVGLQEYFIF